MALETYLSGVLVATSDILMAQRGYSSIPNAADGTGAQAGVVFDDPDGAITVTGWQIVQTMETDCVSAPTLFYGSVYDRTYRRGPYSSGASREIDTTLNDANGFLHIRLVTGGDANRPEETDTARLAWLIGSNSLSGMVYDLGFVNGTGRTCDAANYRGMYPDEVLADIAAPRDQIFFAYYDDAAAQVGLFFDYASATTYTCTLDISNVLSDVDDTTTFAPMLDGELYADPSEVYSGIRYVYTGGVVYRSRPDTAAAFFPVPYELRSFQVENDKVGKQTTAIILADRILEADSEERFNVKFTVRLPSAKVGLIRPGMRIFLRFSHLPGYEAGAYARIQRLNYIPIDRRDFYDVAVECSDHGLTGATPPGSSGGSTDPYPQGPPQTASHWYPFSFQFTSDGYGTAAGPTADPTNHTVPATSTNTAIQTFIANTDYTYEISMVVSNVLDSRHQIGLGNSAGGWSTILHFDDTSGTGNITISGTFNTGSLSGGSEQDYALAQLDAYTHVPHVTTVTGWIDPVGWDTGVGTAEPAPGKPIEDETPTPDPDGIETVFTTAFPVATNSLHVTMNGSELDSGVDFTETTSTTFTFTDPPPTDAQIVVWYIAGA